MKTIFWTSTILLSIFLTWSAYTYLFSKATIDGVRELGFPDHFRAQLAVLKIIAVALLLIPQVSLHIKDAAYVGVGLFLVTAIVAHIAHKDSIFITVINLILIGVLIISHTYLHKLTKIT